MTSDVLRPPLDEWLEAVVQEPLTLDGPTNAVATGNMHAFSLDRATADLLSPDDLVAFLDRAFQVFRGKLAPFRRPAWFYVWVDEMAGQLRMSAVAGATPKDLPFGCDLAPTSDPGVVARDFLSTPSLEGIPWSEFQEVKHDTPDPPRAPRVLTVLARPLRGEATR